MQEYLDELVAMDGPWMLEPLIHGLHDLEAPIPKGLAPVAPTPEYLP